MTRIADAGAAVAAFEEGIAARAASPAFQNYLDTRRRVLAMMAEGCSAEARPSEYWEEELGAIDYIADASPLVVDKLRHHTYHVTGVWPYNYRTGKDRSAARHATKLSALRAQDARGVFVPESPLLGGFGFTTDEGFYNVDTLKFYEVLIALDKGAVLAPHIAGDRRRVVMEIGPGWGGFAYQFLTLAPRTTYVLVDLPQLFLFSATYLRTLFPDASTWFYGTDGLSSADVPWDDVDLVFIPHTAVRDVVPPSVDLTLNMVSFQEMTTDQVRGYVTLAHHLGSPFIYSLNRERSVYNAQLSGVSALLQERYWCHEVDVLSVTYNNFPDEIPQIDRSAGKTRHQDDYRHIIGWRKLGTAPRDLPGTSAGASGTRP